MQHAPISGTLVVASGEVQIWSLPLVATPAELARCRALLSSDECARAARFCHERDRRRYILARGSLRALLGRYLGADPATLRFCYGPQGKPSLVAAPGWPDLEFNLAHAGALALYAVTRGRAIGIDLEPVDPALDMLAIGRQVFSAGELAVLGAAPPAERPHIFFRLWTRKEALIKAHGVGMSLDLRQIDLPVAGKAQPAPGPVQIPDGRSFWLVDVTLGPDYIASCALAGSAPPTHTTIATLRSYENCNTTASRTL